MSQSKHIDTRDRILEAAFDLFTEELFNNVTLDNIAQRAGVSKGGVFHYFKSKEELAAKSLSFGVNKLWAPFLMKFREKKSPKEKLIELIDFTFEVLTQKPKLMRFSLEIQELDLVSVVQEDFNYGMEYVKAFELLFLESNAPNPRYRAHLLHACLDGLALQLSTMKEDEVELFDIEQLKKTLFDIFLG